MISSLSTHHSTTDIPIVYWDLSRHHPFSQLVSGGSRRQIGSLFQGATPVDRNCSYRWSHLRAGGYTCVQVITPAYRWSHLYAGGHSCIQVVTPAYRWSELHTGGYTCVYARVITCIQVVTRACRWSHLRTGGNTCIKVARAYRWHTCAQVVTRAYRWLHLRIGAHTWATCVQVCHLYTGTPA